MDSTTESTASTHQAAPATANESQPRKTGKIVRDPKKVYVAMVLGDTLTKETGLFWEDLGVACAMDSVEGFSFVRTRVTGMGLGKCRNIATWMAARTDAGRFVFIDSDVKCTMPQLLRLVSHDVAAVSAFYPKKRADRLEWVGNFLPVATRPDGLKEVMDFGGGFCSIDLNVVDLMIAAVHETTWFVCEDEPFKEQIMHDLWATGRVVDNWRGRAEFPRFLSEDFYFCHRLRKMGVPIFMDSQLQVGHVGPVDFLEVHTRIKDLENQSIFRAPV